MNPRFKITTHDPIKLDPSAPKAGREFLVYAESALAALFFFLDAARVSSVEKVELDWSPPPEPKLNGAGKRR